MTDIKEPLCIYILLGTISSICEHVGSVCVVSRNAPARADEDEATHLHPVCA